MSYFVFHSFQAYKTFGNRLNSLKKKVDHKVAKIINAEAEKKKMGPITTPQASFLTSGLPDISSTTPSSTPPHRTEQGDNNEKVADTTVDNNEVADMDIDDDGDSENGETSETPSETASTPSTESKTSVTTKSDNSVKPEAATATTTSSSQTPSSDTSVAFSSSSAMPVPVAVPQQMMIPQPNMQFIPGQPGMPLLPVGMHGTGQFIHMPSQYHQPMVTFGMPMHGGMSTFPGSVQTPMPGLLPGQPSFTGQNIGLVSNLPQQLQPSMSIPLVSVPQAIPVQTTPGQTTSQITTTTASSVTPQVSHTTTTPTPLTEVGSRPLPTNIPSTEPSEVTDSRPESIDSPSSEMSAPSPVGSPELDLGGDETPETASPQQISEVKIIGFPSMSSQPDGTTVKETSVPSEGTSSPSTGSVTPNHNSEPSKPVSAVNILAQLISRGRKLKERTPDVDVPSEASTPKEEVTEPAQSQPEKPLFSLIDSLFPKLTDSLKTLREREKDNETSTSTSEEGSPKQKIEINSMEDDNDPEAGQGQSLEQTDQNIEHRGPFKGPYHKPMGHAQEGPMGPYGIHPPEGPVRQPWNNARFQGPPGPSRPPFREYPQRPHIPPTSPLKGPGLSPRFPGPQRPFEGPPGRPLGPSTQAEFMDSEGIREEYRAGPERSPRQLHSPRGAFPSRPSPGGPGGYTMERGPHPGMHPEEPPVNGPPRSPRGSFVGAVPPERRPERGPPLGMHPDEPPVNGPPRSPRGPFVGVGPPERRPPHGMPREEQRPHFHFDGPHGNPSRPPGPPDIYGRPGGSPRHSPIIDGPPPRWLGPEGPRGPLPPPTPPQDGRPRGFQRPHGDGGPMEMGEPPMKRPMMDEGHPHLYPEPGRLVRFPQDERVSVDRNREIWRERDPWEPHRDPHLGPRPDRGRPPNEFPEREEHLPPRYIEQENPFPHERFPPPRRNSFKGYDEHYMDQRPRLPFPGPRPRPYF